MTRVTKETRDEAITIAPVQKVVAKYIEEAPLYFAKGTQDIDPKRGLAINGPYDKIDGGPQTIRVGIVSTAKGIQDVTNWALYANDNPIRSSGEQAFVTPTFPGFMRAFDCRLILSKEYNEQITSTEVSTLTAVINPNQRIRKASELYAAKVENICRRVTVPDVIICHEPDEVEKRCGGGMTLFEKREGALTKEEKEEADRIRKTVATHDILAPLDSDTQNLLDMAVNQDFRRNLKAKCLEFDTPTQILTQSALDIMATGVSTVGPYTQRRSRQDASTIAWNLAAALYYKANRLLWRVGYLQPGSCYIGISFYYDQTTQEKNMFASLAQIFSDTSQGLVVRGDSFKWDVEIQGSPHLSQKSAASLLSKAIGVYKRHHNDQLPNRIVVHKSSKYIDEELEGFKSACIGIPRHDFLALSDRHDYFFYRNGDQPVLRGTTLQLSSDSYMIYTNGYVPYLKQYSGPRVPRALEITEHHGDSPFDELAMEIIALTRLNWNTTDYSCNFPITLEFSRKVGEILGKVPADAKVQEQYRYYM